MMKDWTEKHIRGLLHEKKIAGFKAHPRVKNYSEDKPVVIPREKPKGVIWLDLNLAYWCNERLLTLEKEYRFDTEREWRSDWAIPALNFLIEYEGGIFMKRSGHNSTAGISRDVDKYTRAQVLGWQVIRVTALNYTTVLKTLNELYTKTG